MIRLLFGCILLFIAFMPAQAAKRVALVVGNSAYEHVPELANPKNDAEVVAASLARLDFEVIKGIDLTQPGFVNKVREFSKAIRGADIALFYYAGHGLQVNGRNYLAPIETRLLDEADLDFEAVRLQMVLSQMEREPRTNLVILDACRNNPLARNLASSMGTRSATVGRGLAPIESGIGTLIAFATQPGNVALDGEGTNSPFTSALVKHLDTPGEDIAVTLRRVRQDVITQTGGKQVPWSNSSLTGAVVLKQARIAERKPDENAAAAAALRKQLEQAQRQLKKAQEELNDRPSELAKDAEVSSGSAGINTISDNGKTNSGEAEIEIAGLPSEEVRPETPNVPDADLAKQDFDIARKIDTQRGWQLFLRKHGKDPIYRPRVLKKLGRANGSENGNSGNPQQSDYPGLGRSGRLKIQTTLNARGYAVGDADGVFGPKTRSAIKEFQRTSGIADTGFADSSLLNILNINADEFSSEIFVSDKEARMYQIDDLTALGEKQIIIDTINCLGKHRLLIYGQRGDRLYFAVLGQSNTRSQRKLADECGGALVTLEDAATNNYVYELFRNDPRFFRTNYNKPSNTTEKYGPTIGLWQDAGAYEPSGGWNWLDGDKSRYRNWYKGQPDNNAGFSMSARFFARRSGQPEMANVNASQWADFPGGSSAFIMQIENKN